MKKILILTCILFITVTAFAQDTNIIKIKGIKDTLIFKQDASGNMIIIRQSVVDDQIPRLDSINKNQTAVEFHEQRSKALINQTGADNRVVISVTDSSRENRIFVKQKGKQNQASIYINGENNKSVIDQAGNSNDKKQERKTNKKYR
ncbi:MAG: hypothetical protein IMY70_00745 [Bacteroidetes bacterium]|nr:hypothetical protein [Bacteroidota bacterium]